MNNQSAIFTAAKQAAGDAATVAIHAGDKSHRAIRVTGCFSRDARAVCERISDAIEPLVIKRGGYPAVRCGGDMALVWWQ